MKAHTNQVNPPSLLNNEADHYASKSQNVTNSLHPTPIPTFFMDRFTFLWPHDRWIESNIHTFVDHSLVQNLSQDVLQKHHNRMAKWIYDPHPLPTYPYVKVMVAYSAVVCYNLHPLFTFSYNCVLLSHAYPHFSHNRVLSLTVTPL